MIQRIEAGRNLNHGMIADLGATLSEQIGRGVTAVHMDASRVLEFDSETLEALLEFDQLARSRDLAFVITHPSELLATALSITGIDQKLDVQTEDATAQPVGAAGVGATAAPTAAPHGAGSGDGDGDGRPGGGAA